jgi:GTPase SAR1 family protein
VSSEFLLLGLGNAGKSTFTGGLMYYLENVSDLSRGADYDVEFMYNEAVIKREIIDPMWRTGAHEYPDKTENPYLIRIYLYEGTVLPQEITIDIMDIPGEKQEPASVDSSLTGRVASLLPGNKSPRQELIDEYVTELKPKMNDPTEEPTTNEWEQIFQYRYLRSDSVIVMLNLHKLQNMSTSPGIVDSSQDILSVASGKRRKLILATACDVVGYDPETFDGGQESILSGTIRDTKLAREIQNSISIGDNEISRMLNQVMRNDSNFSFFGVSVPAEDATVSDNIRTNDAGEIEPRGFETVIEWLKQ